jgi:hypothetical protein
MKISVNPMKNAKKSETYTSPSGTTIPVYDPQTKTELNMNEWLVRSCCMIIMRAFFFSTFDGREKPKKKTTRNKIVHCKEQEKHILPYVCNDLIFNINIIFPFSDVCSKSASWIKYYGCDVEANCNF